MITSMTGFGSSFLDVEERDRLVAEIRSINSKFLDIHIHIPEEFSHLEPNLRKILTSYFMRGRVDLRVFLRKKEFNSFLRKNTLLLNLKEKLKIVREVIPDVAAPKLLEILNFIDRENLEEHDSEILQRSFLRVSELAIQELKSSRICEGGKLFATIKSYIAEIQSILDTLEKDLPILLEKNNQNLKNRLQEKIRKIFHEDSSTLLESEITERILQETLTLALRTDISEELSRLRSHIAEFTKVFVSNHVLDKKLSSGRFLDFLCQEMNRESNTLGSKSNDIEVTRAAINLKLLIEKVREQAQNIE